MSPRPYRLGRRREAAEQTRARVLAAARELLAAGGGFTGFTIDAVARQAGVARMTVYYQFRSKRLLEVLCDFLAVRGGIEAMPGAFQQPDPLDGLDGLIAIFGRFWDSDRVVIRRLQGLAALDPDIEQVVRARGERRRHALRVLVGRLQEGRGRPAPEMFDDIIDMLFTLTSFETFDTLAGTARRPVDVTPVVCRLARAVLGVRGGDPAVPAQGTGEMPRNRARRPPRCGPPCGR
jgi:AcrR family transcriptional regulator